MSMRFNTLAARGSLLATLAFLSTALLAISLFVNERVGVPLSIAGFVGLVVLRFVARDSRLLRRSIPRLR
ncbi:MAG: hypothetical protein ACT4P6_09300 [Gemmatimonadaceae bacterium]